MDQYAGIDVSLECSSVCVVDANGKILREAKVASEPKRPDRLVRFAAVSTLNGSGWRPDRCRNGCLRR